jgi:hypothetical protein
MAQRPPTKYDNPVTPADEIWRPRDQAKSQSAQGAAPGAFPYSVVPPEEGLHFVLQDEMDSAAAGIIDFTAAGGTLVVEAGYFGVIAEVQFFATNADATMAGSAFRIRLDGAAPVGWSTIRIPQVGGTGIVGTDKAYIPIQGPQVVSVQFINSLGSAHHVGFFLHGWTWPASLGR